MPKAEYEVVERKHGRIKVKIWIEGQREPIQHGVPVKKAMEHPEGVEQCICDHVCRIAERHADPGIDEDEIPESGVVEFEPNKPGRRGQVNTEEERERNEATEGNE